MGTHNYSEIMDIEQLAAYLSMSKSTIYKMVQKREIPAKKIGALWRFKKGDIDTWLGQAND